MSILRRGVVLSVAVVAAVTIAGCAGTVLTNATRLEIGASTSLGNSTSTSRALSNDLLYVSDYGAHRVDVYSYSLPKLSRVGSLRRPPHPSGSCVDANGDVFITNYAYSKSEHTVEYAHGAITPTRTLGGAVGLPSSCAVDPSTGNIAVATNTTNDQSTDVAVYTNATGLPTLYQSPDIVSMSGCTYDTNGDLYIVGVNYNGAQIFNELVRGASALEDFTVQPALSGAGDDLQWVKDRLVVAESSSAGATIDRYAVSGNRAQLRSSTKLDGANTIQEFDILGHTVVAIIQPTGQVSNIVAVFPYPHGGAAIAKLSKFANAQGVVVSPSTAGQ